MPEGLLCADSSSAQRSATKGRAAFSRKPVRLICSSRGSRRGAPPVDEWEPEPEPRVPGPAPATAPFACCSSELNTRSTTTCPRSPGSHSRAGSSWRANRAEWQGKGKWHRGRHHAAQRSGMTPPTKWVGGQKGQTDKAKKKSETSMTNPRCQTVSRTHNTNKSTSYTIEKVKQQHHHHTHVRLAVFPIDWRLRTGRCELLARPKNPIFTHPLSSLRLLSSHPSIHLLCLCGMAAPAVFTGHLGSLSPAQQEVADTASTGTSQAAPRSSLCVRPLLQQSVEERRRQRSAALSDSLKH